jgi:lipopolysaccharide export system permease protein
VGVICGAAIFILNEFWVPKAADKSKDILQRRKNANWDRNWVDRLEFYNEADARHWNMLRFNRKTAQMIAPTLTWQSSDGFTHWLSARSGVYTNGEWRFYDAERWDKETSSPALQTSNAVMNVAFSETPASIRTEIKVTALTPTEAAKGPQLSIRELITYLRWHPHLDREKRWPALMTQLQGRIAAPFTCIAVILIALPFGARSGRQNVFVGVAGSIFICFAYFILQRISFGLGVASYLPPVVAAWLPNILFGLTGIILISRVR